jgi:hypothetical protein
MIVIIKKPVKVSLFVTYSHNNQEFEHKYISQTIESVALKILAILRIATKPWVKNFYLSFKLAV